MSRTRENDTIRRARGRVRGRFRATYGGLDVESRQREVRMRRLAYYVLTGVAWLACAALAFVALVELTTFVDYGESVNGHMVFRDPPWWTRTIAPLALALALGIAFYHRRLIRRLVGWKPGR